MHSAIQPSAERRFVFFCVSVCALYERTDRDTDIREARCCRRRESLWMRRRV